MIYVKEMECCKPNLTVSVKNSHISLLLGLVLPAICQPKIPPWQNQPTPHSLSSHQNQQFLFITLSTHSVLRTFLHYLVPLIHHLLLHHLKGVANKPLVHEDNHQPRRPPISSKLNSTITSSQPIKSGHHHL